MPQTTVISSDGNACKGVAVSPPVVEAREGEDEAISMFLRDYPQVPSEPPAVPPHEEEISALRISIDQLSWDPVFSNIEEHRESEDNFLFEDNFFMNPKSPECPHSGELLSKPLSRHDSEKTVLLTGEIPCLVAEPTSSTIVGAMDM